MNKIAGYRKMVANNQRTMADKLGLSLNGYRRKEQGLSEFKPSEMRKFTEEVRLIKPNVTEQEIFFD